MAQVTLQDRRAYRRRYRATEQGRAARRREAANRYARPEGRAVIEAARRRRRAAGLVVDRRVEYRARVAAIKITEGCCDCGYNAHPAALHFDHVTEPKLGAISDLIKQGVAWAVIEAEIAKCEVRCANCHAVRTAERAGAGRAVPRA
jgi:hypothetical protein